MARGSGHDLGGQRSSQIVGPAGVLARTVAAVPNPTLELTTRFSAADDALAIWAQDGPLDGPDVDNALVSCDAGSRVDGQIYVVLTGNRSTVAVTTQYFAAPPFQLGDEWEDVVELSVTAGAPLAITELVELEPTALTPDAGTFRVRVAGAGRAPQGTERYLIQAWPAEHSPAVVARLDSTFAASIQAREEIALQGAQAKSAAARIGADLDQAPGARRLTGETGTVTVARDIPARRRKLFSYLLRGFPGWSGNGGPLPDIALNRPFFNSPPLDGSEPLCGESGMLKRVRLEEISPRLRVQSFAWVRPEPGVMLRNSTRHFPEQGTVLTTTWEEHRDTDGLVRTTITINHAGLPVEWLDDMSTWWTQQLAWIDWHVRFRR